jgi:hypothetical protein
MAGSAASSSGAASAGTSAGAAAGAQEAKASANKTTSDNKTCFFIFSTPLRLTFVKFLKILSKSFIHHFLGITSL